MGWLSYGAEKFSKNVEKTETKFSILWTKNYTELYDLAKTFLLESFVVYVA